MESFGKIAEAILGDETAFLFCAIIVAWLAVAAILALAGAGEKARSSRFLAITPNSLTTIGVLGTFTGILIGLIDFDVEDIQESVPSLLEGLKIAFTTSVVGILAAIMFRLIRVLGPGSAVSEGVSPEDIHAALIDIRDDSRGAAARAGEQLTELRRAIASDGDGSLLTQIQKLRTTVQDGQSELIREFREFARHMAENNQKALIEALETVIRDFNQNLTEQFGENFKQLNEAVHALVAWQDKYREHVEGLEARIEAALRAVEAAQAALQSVESHAERIPTAISALEPVMLGLESQTKALGAQLEAIAALRDKAVEAFPVIEGNLERLTTTFASGIEETVASSRKALAEGEAAQAELRKGYDAFLQDAAEARTRFAQELAAALKQMSEQSSKEFARHGELIEASSAEAQKAINTSWAQSVEKMNEQFETFDRQMQQELTRSLELLGRNLASISEKFVTDYTPLTQRLRELVNITRSADR